MRQGRWPSSETLYILIMIRGSSMTRQIFHAYLENSLVRGHPTYLIGFIARPIFRFTLPIRYIAAKRGQFVSYFVIVNIATTSTRNNTQWNYSKVGII